MIEMKLMGINVVPRVGWVVVWDYFFTDGAVAGVFARGRVDPSAIGVRMPDMDLGLPCNI
jgi:hypothetical protein